MINTNRFMIILFLVLIAYEIILFSITMASGKDAYSVSNRMTEPLTLTSTDTTKKPDIYYIIFDSYTNPVTLKKYWQYDNDIVPFLSSKGFFVVDSGFSNYSSTPFSISSILNLQYLKGVSPYLLSNSSNFLLGRETYLDNVLYKFLREQGYAFSIFSQLESEKMATKFGVLGVEKPVKWLRKLTLERIYLNPWMIDRFYKLVLKDQQRQPAQITESMRNFREYNDSAIHHILNSCQPGQDSKPVFNFTHIMLPHDPYQVDENGKFMPASLPGGQDMKGYLKQIKYSNTLIRQITECLLHDSSRQKIIIFQGDHGYRHYSKALKNEQFGALNAIYFHDGDYTTLTRKISHVNTYRIVLNKFFRTRLPILQDTVAMISAD